MIIRDFLPGTAVSEFVQCYRIVHFEFDKAENIPIKALPPKPELFCNIVQIHSLLFRAKNHV